MGHLDEQPVPPSEPCLPHQHFLFKKWNISKFLNSAYQEVDHLAVTYTESLVVWDKEVLNVCFCPRFPRVLAIFPSSQWHKQWRQLTYKSVDPVLSSGAAALHETAGCLGLWCGHLMLIVSDVVELPEPGSKEKTVWVLPEVLVPSQ